VIPGQVAVVTDSSACLRPGDENCAALIVPLRVLAGGAAADDAPGPLPDLIADELRRGERLSTARPSPQRFTAVYAAAAARGAVEIVSVHLSGELSSAIGSARLAAATAPVPVRVVDSRSIGAGLGLVVATAVLAAAAGQPAAEVEQAAISQAARLGSFFALDSQDQLRDGGRLSQPGGPRPGQYSGYRPALGPAPGPDERRGGAGGRARGGGSGAGSMLRSRPILAIRDGRIIAAERVRTRAAAAERLTELAAGFAVGRPCQVAVQHLDNEAGAAALRRQLIAAIPAAARICLVEAGTAIRAHTGPGLLGVAVALMT
jgi:fatty acid-binding protein DegV